MAQLPHSGIKSENQLVLGKSKLQLRKQFPDFGPKLLDLLERDESTIVYARSIGPNQAALRVAPSAAITKQFDISLEIPVLIAAHPKLEPRALRDLDTSTELRASASADKDVAILVAVDPLAHQFVKDRKRFAFPILVLDASRLQAGEYATSTIRLELARLLRSVNHFDFSNEILRDVDFFGRLDEIDALTALATSGQSAGIFGLRRAGKTSLLFRVRRALETRGISTIFIQLNAMVDDDGLRGALLHELTRLAAERHVKAPSHVPRDLTAREWVYRMDALLDALDTDVVVLIDEIDLANEDAAEFDESEIDQRKALNRVLQQVRGLIQIRNDRGKHRLSFLSAGVAASIFTRAVRFDRDNQLFGFASARPLKPMSRDEMREMVRTLGKRSGLKFGNHHLFDMLFSEYGGHPHLTRQACSAVAEARQAGGFDEVPYPVVQADLTTAFERVGEGTPADAAWQTLLSFERWYPDEADIVRRLAVGEVSEADEASVSHAIGFGLCDDAGRLRMMALSRHQQ